MKIDKYLKELEKKIEGVIPHETRYAILLIGFASKEELVSFHLRAINQAVKEALEACRPDDVRSLDSGINDCHVRCQEVYDEKVREYLKNI